MLRILFLCTENACRSQMAEGLVNHFLAGQAQAFSAGLSPTRVNPRAVAVLAELGLDISKQRSKSVNDLAGEQVDLVVTVCDRAREQCPLFPGPVKKIHLSFADPAQASGSEEEVMAVFRKVRDEMREKLLPLLTREAEGK